MFANNFRMDNYLLWRKLYNKVGVYMIPTLVLQLPALVTFPLQVRISLHSYVVSYVTYKLSVCKQLLTSTHGSIATPASITLTGPSATTS